MSGITVRRVADVAKVAHVSAGQFIVREGFSAEAFYILVTGKATVLRGGAADVGLSRGDFFGELGLLDEAERTASVVADTDLWPARLPRDFFDRWPTSPPSPRAFWWPRRSACDASNPSALGEFPARKTISLTATRSTTGTAHKGGGRHDRNLESILAREGSCVRLAHVGILGAVLIGAAACGGGGGGSTTPSSQATSTSAHTTTSVAPPPSGTATSGAPTSGGKKIVVVYLENHNYADIEGNACCPYETKLSHEGILFTNFFGVAYPSKPNYLAFGGGGTFGQAGSDNPLPLITSESVFHQMSVMSIDWKAWAENYPGSRGNCYLQPTGPMYAMRHVAPLLFADVGQTPLCNNLSGVEPRVLPQFLWVTPNMCNDDHDCPPSTGDAWLAAHVPTWLAQDAEVLITFDTGNPDTTHGGGHVYTVLVGKTIKPATDGTLMDHYSALAGVEKAFGLPLLGSAKTANPVPF